MHFGLAFKNETFMGSDDLTRTTSMNKTIKTVDRCTYGSMTDLTLEQNIDQQFENDCTGKGACTMFLNFTDIFDDDCNKELNNRLDGNT